MHRLIIEDDEGKTTVVPLIRDEITIGRKEGNTIRLTERNVSRAHARITRDSGKVFVEDLSSHNGVRVNGARIEGRVGIEEGDRIQIGDYLLAVRRETDAAVLNGGNGASGGHEDLKKTVPGLRAMDTIVDTAPMLIPMPMPMPPSGASGGGATSGQPLVEPSASIVSADAVPADPMDIAPTIPVRPPEAVARLFVLVGPKTGQEFRVDGEKAVIGRTSDNDVVIDQRSISRHHATLLREEDRYVLLDLRSANGVRVNGEEYRRVELQHNDLIDLGQVRLRFVAPGQRYLYAEDQGASMRFGMGLWKILPVVVLGAVGILGWQWWEAHKIPTSGEVTAEGAEGIDPELPAATPQTEPATTGTGATVTAADEQGLTELLTAEQWGQAQTQCGRLTGRPAASPNIRSAIEQGCSRARAEELNQSAFERYLALTPTDADQAIGAYREIADDSTYKHRTPPSTELKARFVKVHLDRAAELQKAHDCEAALHEVTQVLSIDEANAKALRIRGRCDQAVADKPGVGTDETETTAGTKGPPSPTGPVLQESEPAPPTTRARPGASRSRPETSTRAIVTPTTVEPPAAPSPQRDAGESPDQLFSQAVAAYSGGHYDRAVELCKQTLLLKPYPQAVNIWVLSECRLRHSREALKAFELADDRFRPLLRTECRELSIDLP